MFNVNDDTYKRITSRDIRNVFLLGGLAGMLVFIACYGVSILDVTNDAWLLSGEDITQHYIGWKFYRASEWTFPIGQIQGILYPQTSCIIYSDSNPLLAIFFKLFSPLLPETFQYFGISGLLSFFLVGAFAGVIARRGTESRCYCFLAAGLTSFSPYLFYRMFIHTALASQWIILAAITIWVYRPYFSSWKKKTAAWTILLVAGTLTHIYYIPMVMLFFFGFGLQDLISGKGWKEDLAAAVVSIGVDLAVLYIVGAFSVHTSMEDTGLGVYSANVNSLINPVIFSRFLPGLPYGEGQLEGFGYLGLGVLILTAGTVILAIYGVYKNRKKTAEENALPEKNGRRDTLAAGISVTIVFLLGFLLAFSPVIRCGENEVLTIQYPQFIISLLSVFRTTGRFIWCVAYFIISLGLITVGRMVKKKGAVVFLAVLLVVQAVDVWPLVQVRKELVHPESGMVTMKSEEWETLAEGKIHLTILPWSTVHGMNGLKAAYETGNFAVDHGMTINYFPIARIDYEKLAEEDGVLRQKAENREDEDTLYILDTREAGEVLGLVVYEIDGYYVGVRE